MMETLKRVFVEDWKAKLFSIFFAFIIWLLISLDDWSVSERSLIIPVNFIDLPPNITVLSASTSTVEVFLKVPKRLEGELKKTGAELNLSISEFKTGQVVIPLRGTEISNIPKGVEIYKIKPSSIVLNLDRLVEKTVPVEPVFEDKVEKEKIDFDPKRVRVLCPSTLVPVLKNIPTEPLNLNSLKKNKKMSVPLISPDPRIILLEPKMIRISIEE